MTELYRLLEDLLYQQRQYSGDMDVEINKRGGETYIEVIHWDDEGINPAFEFNDDNKGHWKELLKELESKLGDHK